MKRTSKFGFGRLLARKFLRDRSATAAIEFAMTVPALTAVVLGLSDTAQIGMQASEMQTAARASIQYVMNGGADLSVAKTQATQAWPDMPKDGAVTVTQACVCGAAAGTCGTVCTDGSVPGKYVTVVASATMGGDMYSYKKTVTESVRTQ
jgi:Flp pilus assembly protein TadG